MSLVLAVVSLLAVPFAVPAQAREPSTSELAASVTIYDPRGSVTVYETRNSVTVLRTEAKKGEQTVVTISSDVLFDFASATLTSEATAKLKELAGRIGGTTQPVTVVGHTDSIGDDASNAVLSNQRAQAAGAVLRASLPPGTQIATEGRAAREPVAPNSSGGEDDPVGRAKNRRVTVSFTPRTP